MSDTGPQFTLEQDGVFTRVNMEYTNDALDAMAQRAAERIEDELAQQLLARLGYVKVVRCKDCEFYTPERMYREARGFGVYEDMWEPGGCFNPKRCRIIADSSDPSGEWNVVGIDTEPDGYCAWGKRKEVAE